MRELPSDPVVRLSEAGQARRAMILGELQSARARRARLRAVRRGMGAGGAAASVLAVVLAWQWGGGMGAEGPRTPAIVQAPRATAVVPRVTQGVALAKAGSPYRHLRLVSAAPRVDADRLIRADDDRVTSMLVRPRPEHPAAMLDDASLVAALARTGEVYGLVRAGANVAVVCYSTPAPGDVPAHPAAPAPVPDDGSL